MFFRCRSILTNSTKNLTLFWQRTSTNEVTRFDPCTGCEIPCTKHVSYPAEILEQIDQSNMINSVDKYRRHLCIGQSVSSSQWPKDVKDLQDGYIKELGRILKEKKDAIGYSVKLTLASISSSNSSEQVADWYLFPDQVKLKNIHIKQFEQVIQKLFVDDPKKKVEEQLKETKNSLSLFNEEIKCERLDGLWVLVCCHYQRDQRCGVIGPILVDEIEKHVRKTNRTDHVHCLKISHIGGHRFAGNVIVYPSGTWYGRVLPCHIPLLIDAYASSSNDLKDKLKPLLRGHLEST